MTTMLADRAFSLVSELHGAATLPAVEAKVGEAATAFGFDAFVLVGLRDHGEAVDPRLMIARFPLHWVERYVENGYAPHDPVIRHMRRSRAPFTWARAVEAEPPTAMSQRVMDEAREVGLASGLGVPIHGPGGLIGSASFAGGAEEKDPAALAALQLIGLAAFDRAREITGVALAQPNPLTARETECLAWAAQGKTSWECGEILGISERTVESYLKGAAQKLRAGSRTHAVAIALRHRWIH